MRPQVRTIEQGLIKVDHGQNIWFRDGVFETEDEKVIKFLEEYMAAHPNTVFKEKAAGEKAAKAEITKKVGKE